MAGDKFENRTDYATVAASQTKQRIGTAKMGQIIDRIIVVPATVDAGAVTLYDSSGASAIPIFTGGTASLTTLAPITVELRARSKGSTTAEGWYVTTGAAVSCIVVGSLLS